MLLVAMQVVLATVASAVRSHPDNVTPRVT